MITILSILSLTHMESYVNFKTVSILSQNRPNFVSQKSKMYPNADAPRVIRGVGPISHQQASLSIYRDIGKIKDRLPAVSGKRSRVTIFGFSLAGIAAKRRKGCSPFALWRDFYCCLNEIMFPATRPTKYIKPI